MSEKLRISLHLMTCFCMIRHLWYAVSRPKRPFINIAWCLALGLEERRGLYRGFPMKKNIHPNYTAITATCSCGNVIKTHSTVGHSLPVRLRDDVASDGKCFFCAAYLSIARGVHNLVVPLCCLHSFNSLPCYLKEGGLTSFCER